MSFVAGLGRILPGNVVLPELHFGDLFVALATAAWTSG